MYQNIVTVGTLFTARRTSQATEAFVALERIENRKMEESELGKFSVKWACNEALTLELVAKQILKQEGAASKEPSPATSTELMDQQPQEETQIKDLFKSVISPPENEPKNEPNEPNESEIDVESVRPEEVESLFKRLNNQNRLSVTDSILSTTSTETPSTVRAAGEKTDTLTTSQEDLLTEDITSVASGSEYLSKISSESLWEYLVFSSV